MRASIGELSDADLGIDSFTVSSGEYGVGDKVDISFNLTNAGKTLISFGEENPIEIEFLLSQRGGIWGNGPDGHSVSVSHPIQSLELNMGARTTINLDLEIPESVLPGAYHLSARIKNHPLLGDPISANDYVISNEVAITIPERTLQIVETGNGEVTSDTILAKIPFKKPVRLVPKAFFGHEFSIWTGDLESASEIATIIMDTDKQVEATFVPKTYNIDVQSFGSGSVGGLPDGGYTTYGDFIQLEAVAEGDALFLGWSGDRVSTEPVIQIEVGRDLQIVARFSQSIDAWLEERFSAEQLNDLNISGLLADPDGNRFTNLQEFLFGFEMKELEPPRIEFYRRGSELCLRYPRSLTTIGDERLEVWYSQDLHNWENSGINSQVVSTEGGVEYIEACLLHPENEPIFFEIRAIAE